jgi:hypothetical protein
MTGTDVLRMLLDGSFNLVRTRMEELGDAEWDQRALPGTNKLGFILWHCARIVDWTAHSAIQGVPEVADRQPWRDLHPAGSGYGAGIPDALADTVTATVTRTEALAYLAEVRAELMPWFDRQTPQTLDAVPALKAHQQRTPGYLDAPVWAAVENLDGLTAWQLLARPCISHVRVHVGEYGVLLDVLRSKASTRSQGAR